MRSRFLSIPSLMPIYALLLGVLHCGAAFGQTYSGSIKDIDSNNPLEYVSIGIIGRSVGTVSDRDGNYTLNISEKSYDNDSIKFSFIGCAPLVMKVIDYKSLPSKDISLTSQPIELGEVIIRPMKTEEKILGNKYNGILMQAGFKDNDKGFELGVLLKIKKRAILKELVCNIADCTYDSVFYRVNIYKQEDNKTFENILQNPIYFSIKIDRRQTSLIIDLSQYYIIVEGNTLITLEHIEDMGEGRLFFSCGMFGSASYYRKTSHDNWSKTPVKLGFSVRALVEQ